MRGAGGHDRDRRHEDADPQRDREPRDRSDPPIEHRDVDQAHDGRDQEHARRGRAAPQIGDVLREADVAGGDLERAAQHELPDEQKRHQPAERLRAERLAQIAERPARSRHRRAELAPHHAVGDDDHERDDPAEHRLRPAERGHQQRDRDERADPDHVDHVERGGFDETETASQGHGVLEVPGFLGVPGFQRDSGGSRRCQFARGGNTCA